MIDYKQELNEEQLKVVERGDGPCLVLAGAGSGKTRTITYRVAYLLEQGIRPDEILLVTFTNKAAREMVHRIQELPISIEKFILSKAEGKIFLPWSGTFHHIAFRLLKQYASLIGYANNFTVLDAEDSKDILKLCLKMEGVDRTQKRFPSANVIHSLISYARNAERALTEIIMERHPQWVDVADTLGRIAGDYDKRKRTANTMDFDDLLVNLYRLLIGQQSLAHKLATQFCYVLVDEYQDTNKIQASIIRVLSSVHRNILVVGDDAQSIYSFRAADIQNILDFEIRYPGAAIFRLETNYRSTPDILEVANEVIANNTKQYQKKLKSIREKFTRPEIHCFADQSEEAEFIAERIVELHDEGVALAHIAVLFRAAFHTHALELELNKRNIPYEYRGGLRFFERAHVKDVLAFLRLYNNPRDTVAWSRALSMQVGIGPGTVEKIIARALALMGNDSQSAQSIDASFFDEIGLSLPSRARVGWNDFVLMWQRMVRDEDNNPGSLITALLDSKYADYLEAEYPDYRERREDLQALAHLAEREEDLGKFLAESVLQEQFAWPSGTPDGSASTSVGNDERIILSTIHQAKGLEWEAVFILNVAAGQFPSERSTQEANGLEEERRLFYVAVTRAKKYLYLSYPLTGNLHSYLQGPSQFLGEISQDNVETYGNSVSSTSFFDPSDAVDDIKYVAEPENNRNDDSEDVPFHSKPRPKSFLKSIDEL